MKTTIAITVLALALCAPGQAMADWVSAIASSNPLNWYRLDELNGTIAVDHGSQGLNGTYGTGVNAPARGIVTPTGIGVSYDGDQDSIILGGADLSGDWSAEFILNRYGAKRSSDLLRGPAFVIPSTALKLEQYDNTGQVGYTQYAAADLTFSPSVATPLGSFVHLVYVKDASGLKAYLNGVLAGTNSSPISLSRYQIGDDVSPDRVLLGNESPFMQLDEVVIYGRALSASEISNHFAAVPEPASLALFALGTVGFLLFARSRMKTGQNGSVENSTVSLTC